MYKTIERFIYMIFHNKIHSTQNSTQHFRLGLVFFIYFYYLCRSFFILLKNINLIDYYMKFTYFYVIVMLVIVLRMKGKIEFYYVHMIIDE